ncbi:MAG: tetratricopeptide repeat protein, partial [Gemmatimonadaceae bacterium]
MATSARLEELKQKFNENPRRYFAPLANEHRKLGDLEQAITLCRTHLPQQPQHVSGHIVLAQALFEAGNTPDARQAFEVALDLDPENLIALRFLGDIARGQGDHLTARHWYERVLDADPRNDEIARLVREIDNGAAAPAAMAEQSAAADTPSVAAEPPVPNADEPNEVTVAAAEPLTSAAPESIEDLATAWQHEAAALDASEMSGEVSEPPVEPEPAPVAMDDAVPAPEPELEVVAQEREPIAANIADEEPPAQPSESWAEPDEYFVANVPTVESSTIPAPSPFTEIDYSLFEAVADEESVALPTPPAPLTPTPTPSEPIIAAPSAAEDVVEQPPAAGDDWFAAPSERESEAPSVGVTSETAFDLDAAFQSVLPNKQEAEDE